MSLDRLLDDDDDDDDIPWRKSPYCAGAPHYTCRYQ